MNDLLLRLYHKYRQYNRNDIIRNISPAIITKKNKKSSILSREIFCPKRLTIVTKKDKLTRNINFLDMNYKETRELLLHAEALSNKQANEILDLWETSPKSYSDFLRNRGCFTFLSCYIGLDAEKEHKFEGTTKRVLSPEIAEKFFRLEDDDLGQRLIMIIAKSVWRQDSESPMSAFPYLNKECVQYMSRELILELLINPLFVFNFEEDTSGEVFELMYQKVGGEQEQELLAVNSFHIEGWVNPTREQRKTVKLFLMSSHIFSNGGDEEACFRKMFLNYIYDIQEGMQMIDKQIKKEQGVTLN